MFNWILPKKKQRQARYQQHLERVSRSFAFCIRQLDEPLREQVSLAYLMCRILDCVEDAIWKNRNEQAESFTQFEFFLAEGVQSSGDTQGLQEGSQFSSDFDFATQLSSWAGRIPGENLSLGEKDLLQDIVWVFACFREQAYEVKQILFDSIWSMARGMKYFSCGREQRHIKLVNLRETNQYCFFVAGVVGEILTRLIQVRLNKSPFSVSSDELYRAYHFGLFLQKVNILKDHQTDENQGRFFITSRKELAASLMEHAPYALEYILQLDQQRLRDFRIFCAWSFFLGLESLPWIEKSWLQKDVQIKIPRVQTLKLLTYVEKHIHDNLALRDLYERKMSESTSTSTSLQMLTVEGEKSEPVVGPNHDHSLSSHAQTCLHNCYRGLLLGHDLEAFGL